MKQIYQFSHDVFDETYARASRLGTWFPEDAELCKECTADSSTRVRPLIIEWEPGSDMIGDFTWPGHLDDIIISQRVRESLEGRFSGFEFGPIRMNEDPKLKKSSSAKGRKKPRVSLPYQGPPLWDLWVTSWCHFDLSASGMVLERECQTCHTKTFKPLAEDQVLIVDIRTWDGSQIFKTYECPACVFCLDEVKVKIERNEFSNVSFSRRGYIGT
jgi:hypothetical protein